MTGIDLREVVLGGGHSDHGAGIEFIYKNWDWTYPDILVQFGTYGHTPNGLRYRIRGSTICGDIGKDETLDQAKERVKTWFYEDVVPLYLQFLFS